MAIAENSLVLIDGSSYLYRAFHALPMLTNSEGFPTGAIYGVINMLKKAKTQYQTPFMTVVFDAPGKTFREDIYPEYKANRSSMPEELVKQVEPLKKMIRAMGFPLLCVEGVEADDVIGTLSHQAKSHGMKVVISTGDKDLAQLVDESVLLVNTMTDVILDEQGVLEKFGVKPSQIVDFLMLTGDQSDHIPGVQGVGPKTAAKWLNQFPSIDELIQHQDELTGKVGETFRAHVTQLPLARTLVTVRTDVPLQWHVDDFKVKEKNQEEWIALLQKFEFKSWLSEALSSAPSESLLHKRTYELIQHEEDLVRWCKRILAKKQVVIDTETNSLIRVSARLAGISLCIPEEDSACYIPISHVVLSGEKQLSLEVVVKHLAPILADPSIEKIGHHLKFDWQILLRHHMPISFPIHDTLLEAYMLDSAGNGFDMDSLALKYLKINTIRYEDVTGKGKHQITFDQVPIDKAGEYSAEDADVTEQLHAVFSEKLKHESRLQSVYHDIELPLVRVLADMEMHGVMIDPVKLKTQEKELQETIFRLEEEAFLLANKRFNLGSPKQLQAVLFDELKLPILQKTPTGQASTADPVLQELAEQFELPRLIIEHRKLSKLMSTYTSKLVEQIQPNTGRIHTSYHQTGTATGRLSSSDPNLQNIPVRSKEGKRIREAFIAPPHKKLVSVDYSQIELRLMAHISKDKALIKAFQDRLDVHRATASEVFGVPPNEVTSDMRRHAKAINFGLIYGMSAFGLMRELRIERDEAEHYIQTYFHRYPGIKTYMEETRNIAREKGFVETLWGRRLYLPDIRASNIHRQKAAERTAINAPLQGSAADIIKLVMIALHERIQQEHLPVHMIMQVHDELVFEVDEQHVEESIQKIEFTMLNTVKLDVPLEVSIGTGNNWDEANAH